MAENTLKKVQDQLNCSICLDTYCNPKLLQCFHVYCRACLVRLVDKDPGSGQLFLTCPNCRHITPVPATGVAGLPPAFHVNYLLEIMDEHKKAEAVPDRRDCPKTLVKEAKKSAVYCLKHPEEELKLYCETCELLICLKCVIKGSEHHSHDYELLDEAFERYQRELGPLMEPIHKQLSSVEEALVKMDECSGEISNQHETIEADICNKIQQLHDSLDQRKSTLLDQLDRISQGKLKGLEAQKDRLEITKAQLTSCLEFVNKSSELHCRMDALEMKTKVVSQVKELTTSFQPENLKPNTIANIMFSVSSDILALCQNYGLISAPGSPDPSKCIVMENGVNKATVGVKSTVFIRAINFKGNLCEEPVQSLHCELVSQITGTSVQGLVERRDAGSSLVSYQPTIKGRHLLNIKVEGQHINGSPFNIPVISPVAQLGIPIQTIGRVEKPWGIAINQRGDVIVAESTRHCLTVLSASGEKLRSFGSYGAERGHFRSPRGIAVDCKGNILVADCYNHCIRKYSVNGQFLTTVGVEGSPATPYFNCPYGVALSTAKNKIYVTDLNHHVQVLNHNLTFSSMFGREGNGRGQFNYPCGIACDSTGKVYVADRHNHRVQVFTADGKFLRMFGREEEGRGELNFPTGIAIDHRDCVYVSDCHKHNYRITVFSPEGSFITSFGGGSAEEGRRQEEFKGHTGLAVDVSGVVYVCDYDRHCVTVY